jgi:hypothetical protein
MSESASFSFVVPVKTVSEANQREHWSVRRKRVKSHRSAAHYAASVVGGDPAKVRERVPLVVRLVRVGPRKLDSDNLSSACKAVRDGIADWLGIDDGRDDLVTWEYDQERGMPSVRVTIAPRGER